MGRDGGAKARWEFPIYPIRPIYPILPIFPINIVRSTPYLSLFTFPLSLFTFHFSPLTFHFIINYAVVSPADFAVSLNLQNIVFRSLHPAKLLTGTMFATNIWIILANIVMYGKQNKIL